MRQATVLHVIVHIAGHVVPAAIFATLTGGSQVALALIGLAATCVSAAASVAVAYFNRRDIKATREQVGAAKREARESMVELRGMGERQLEAADKDVRRSPRRSTDSGGSGAAG